MTQNQSEMHSGGTYRITFDSYDHQQNLQANLVVSEFKMRNRDVAKVLGTNFIAIQEIQRVSGASITFASNANNRRQCHTFVLLKGTHDQVENAKRSIENAILKVDRVEKQYHPVIFMPKSTSMLVEEIPDNHRIRGLIGLEVETQSWIELHNGSVSIHGDRSTLITIMDRIIVEPNHDSETRATLPRPTWIDLFGEKPHILSLQQHEENVHYDKLLSKAFKAMISIVFGLFAVMPESNLLEENKILACFGAFVAALGFLSLLWAILVEHAKWSRFLLSIGIGTEITLLVLCCTYVIWPNVSGYIAVALGVCAIGYCFWTLGVYKKGYWSRSLYIDMSCG